jgi:predicted TIM-barrel fold metal-dependent hydrolase
MPPSLTQPPDPHPKTPRLRLPPGSIDTHIHLFGPAAQYPFHPDSKYIAADALPETQIAQQDTLGLAGAVVVSGGGYGQNSQHLEHVLERFGERFRGVALLPDDADAAHVERLDRLGVRGARFVGTSHKGALPRLSSRIAALIAEFGWHVQFYPGPDDLLEKSQALLDLPVPVVLDHFACIPADGGVDQPAFKALLKMIDTGRIWVKLSGPMRCTPGDYPYAPVTPLARALVAHAPHRLLWGSDWPHVNMNDRGMPNDGDLVDLLSEWIDDTDTLKQILVTNPREVYGPFGGAGR